MEPLSCRTCGLWITEKDDWCPNCGRRNWSAAKGQLLDSLCEILFWIALAPSLGHFQQ
jgi:hypothetical protein